VVPLKKSVYSLPRRDDCLEDFQWIAEEAIAGGGEAFVCEAVFPDARTDAALVRQFRAERNAAYDALASALRGKGRPEAPGVESLVIAAGAAIGLARGLV